MHILVADGDESVLQSIELMLKSESLRVYAIDSGEEAAELGRLYDYDAIVLGDTFDESWEQVVKSLRVAKCRAPIIVVSGERGCARIDRIVHALGIGADDYMTKPFHKDELIARIHAVVRRSKGHTQSRIDIGPLVVDLSTRTATVNGSDIHFTGKEFHLLELFALRAGAVQSKEQVLNYLYGGRDEPELKIIDVFICKLRKKLARAGAPDLIETVWGRGYLLRKPAPEMAGRAA
jgi:two-component system cell cycle response regulator CtrA